MPVGKANAFTGETIQIGRLEFGIRIEDAGVPESLIVGVDDDDIRPLGLGNGVA